MNDPYDLHSCSELHHEETPQESQTRRREGRLPSRPQPRLTAMPLCVFAALALLGPASASVHKEPQAEMTPSAKPDAA